MSELNPIVLSVLEKYKCVTSKDYENALKEIIQEIALLGLWRAKFFEYAAFYGGTALRILYDLDRFSEDLDFSLLKPQKNWNIDPYLNSIQEELNGMGLAVETAIDSAFIKAGTKEHLLKIKLSEKLADKIQNNALLSIKIEMDTDSPGGFDTESKALLQPIPFAVRTYSKPDLFAGKLHAILQRNWKGRVKGRDYYDFIWFLARDTSVNILHLEQRLRQSGGWSGKKLHPSDVLTLLKKKFSELDIEAAKKDVQPFLRDPAAVKIWSKDFFISLLEKLKF